jgi:hypothetical protein
MVTDKQKRNTALTPAEQVQVQEAVERALQWFPVRERETARAKGPDYVLSREKTRTGRIMRKVMSDRPGPVAEASAIDQYTRVQSALRLARKGRESGSR